MTTPDRWWRGLDVAIVEALPSGARVLDIGCGGGGLVRHLSAAGLDAVGVDPRAPDAPDSFGARSRSSRPRHRSTRPAP